jgi:hypothetical protein
LDDDNGDELKGERNKGKPNRKKGEKEKEKVSSREKINNLVKSKYAMIAKHLEEKDSHGQEKIAR